MLLVISLIFVLVPLLGIAYIAVFASLTTVDGLFAALMLLAMAGIFALNILLLLRQKRGSSASAKAAGAPLRAAAAAGAAGVRTPEGVMHRGRVESVQFYEAPVGMANKSIVTLSEGSAGERLLVLDGDVRNALPVGQQVQVTLRREAGNNVIANVQYA
jgi:hypothetical protein